MILIEMKGGNQEMVLMIITAISWPPLALIPQHFHPGVSKLHYFFRSFAVYMNFISFCIYKAQPMADLETLFTGFLCSRLSSGGYLES